jgi:hypothetical protein
MKPMRTAPQWTQRIASQRRGEAEVLVAALANANVIDMSVPDAADLARWRKIVDFAKRHGLVPVGHRLEKQMVGDKLLRIKLVGGVHANTKVAGDSPPVPTPRDLRGAHPAIVVIRDADDQLQIPARMRGRALRVLQATATELERRGSVVTAASQGSSRQYSNNYYGRIAARRVGRIEAVVAGITCSVSVSQHSPLSTDTQRADRMALEIWPWPMHGQHRWVDGFRRRVEDRIGEVLAGMEIAAAELVSRRRAEERDQLRRQAEWEAAIARAKLLAVEERHLRVLRQNVEAWKFAEDLRLYVGAIRARLTQLSVGDDPTKATAWLDWASDFLERYDPVRLFPMLPDPHGEPTIKELEVHLGGRSPYGP